VFDADLGGVLHLPGCSAEQFGERSGCHRARRSDFALTTHFGAADGGVLLDDAADTRRDEQEPHRAVVVGPRHEVVEVLQHGGNDACSAVCRRGHHAPACGVLLVDRDRVQVHAVHRDQRIA
jgi:hypothetical protein